jgi:hypothetical protein
MLMVVNSVTTSVSFFSLTSGTLSRGGGQGQPQSQPKVAGFFR